MDAYTIKALAKDIGTLLKNNQLLMCDTDETDEEFEYGTDEIDIFD